MYRWSEYEGKRIEESKNDTMSANKSGYNRSWKIDWAQMMVETHSGQRGVRSGIHSHRDLKSHRERKREKERDIKISLYFGLKTIRNFRFSAYCPNSLGPISTPLCVHFATRIHAKYKRNSCRAGGNNERKEYFLKCYPFVFLSRVVDKENRKGEDWT